MKYVVHTSTISDNDNSSPEKSGDEKGRWGQLVVTRLFAKCGKPEHGREHENFLFIDEAHGMVKLAVSSLPQIVTACVPVNPYKLYWANMPRCKGYFERL